MRMTHTTDTFLFISHTTNVPLFKFRCNIFIGVRIKEMPGPVASGTHCIYGHVLLKKLFGKLHALCTSVLASEFFNISSFSSTVLLHILLRG
jgi:hypothetical protein